MKTLAHFLVIAGVGASLAIAPAEEPKAVLRQVEETLKPVLAGLAPTPTVEYSAVYSDCLVVQYRPQRFMVHPHRSGFFGGWSTNLVEEIGPSDRGFVLRVFAPQGEVQQPPTPQTVQESYWWTFFNKTFIAGTTNKIVWTLSYGVDTDAKLLASLKRALGSLAGNSTKNKAEPDGSANGSQPIRSETNRTSSAAGSRR